MTLVSRLLATRANARPDTAAFLVGRDGRAVTWRQTAAHAELWDQMVGQRALPSSARVGLMIADPLRFVAGYLGCLAAGLTGHPWTRG